MKHIVVGLIALQVTLARPAFEHQGKTMRLTGDVCGLAGHQTVSVETEVVEDGETVVEVRGGKPVGVYSGRAPGKAQNHYAIKSVICEVGEI